MLDFAYFGDFMLDFALFGLLYVVLDDLGREKS
jgi:hypothetical protein